MEDLLQILQKPLQQREVEVSDLPDLDLYMDQITTLFADKTQEPDGLLTKTMINNYAKNHLLPPPEKKKYSREHMLLLIFIYYFKNILSINDIQSLLSPLTERYFHSDHELQLDRIYTEVFSLEKRQIEVMKEDLIQKYRISQETFSDVSEKDQEFLQLFSFICMLSFDVYMKKQVIEKLIDQLPLKKKKKKHHKE